MLGLVGRTGRSSNPGSGLGWGPRVRQPYREELVAEGAHREELEARPAAERRDAEGDRASLGALVDVAVEGAGEPRALHACIGLGEALHRLEAEVLDLQPEVGVVVLCTRRGACG